VIYYYQILLSNSTFASTSWQQEARANYRALEGSKDEQIKNLKVGWCRLTPSNPSRKRLELSA
jgi:hypothetical protein